MFIEFVIAKAKEQMARIVAQINDELKSQYLQAAVNWAETKSKGEAGPPPVAPFNVSAVFDEANVSFKLIETDVAVSNITAESFLPTYKTDVDAIGGPVGGPIPGEANKFYINSAFSVYAGQTFVRDSAVYVVQQPTPFQKYWLRVV